MIPFLIAPREFFYQKILLKYLYQKLIVTTNDQANENVIEIFKKC